ncbi:hypothetical protein F511_23271 [Dorcoceras hygrometricum]|uniref:Uncharacterized protein n=1 Tax=Dorcoceras hygrometricum TaxID=472368 RepID=A0A2Z7CSF8_9LAMI|nr:hypothetical protein F511_23271 [Dorcoceras hygrometricum]
MYTGSIDVHPLLMEGACLRPISRGNWHFNGWRLSFSESDPRLESRLLRQSTLENVTNLSRMESPRRGGRNKSNHDKRRHTAAAAHDGRRVRGGGREGGRGEGGGDYSLGFCESCSVDNVALGSRTSILPPPMLNKLSLISLRESRNQYLCDPQWFRDTASRGPTTCVTPKPHFRTSPSDNGKAPSNITP